MVIINFDLLNSFFMLLVSGMGKVLDQWKG